MTLRQEGLQQQLSILEELLEQDQEVKICIICYESEEQHLVRHHRPQFWPIQHAVRYLRVAVSAA